LEGEAIATLRQRAYNGFEVGRHDLVRCDMAATVPVDIGTLITRKPGVRGGRPHIAGAGVSVRTIVYMGRDGLTPQEIAEDRSDLTLAQIHAALAYYYANKAQMDIEMSELEAEERRFEEEWLRARNNKSGVVEEAIRRRNRGNHNIG
jgi:uncharacterized protein (DUF433 family)